MNVFISQPMRNRSDEEIKAERQKLMEYVQKLYPNDKAEEIDSFFDADKLDINTKNFPLVMLGMSLELLAEADIAVFADGWSVARGCKIEHDAAEAYGIKILDLED